MHDNKQICGEMFMQLRTFSFCHTVHYNISHKKGITSLEWGKGDFMCTFLVLYPGTLLLYISWWAGTISWYYIIYHGGQDCLSLNPVNCHIAWHLFVYLHRL